MIERKQVRTARQLLESLNAQSHGITPFGALGDLVKQNALSVLDPDYCDEIVDTVLATGREVIPNSEATAILRTPDVANVVFHPAFIRACARRGYSFYISGDGALHRQTHAGRTNVGSVVADNSPDFNFYAEPPWFQDLVRFIEHDQSVLLIGPGGTGKSEAAERAFATRAQPIQIVSCNPSMTADDLEGRIDLRGGETVFTPSPCAVAVRDGSGLLLDETDALNAEACFSLYRFLDKKDMRIIREGVCKGTITRHKSFRVVGTQNTVGRGDDKGLYHGRSLQDEPFIDRWDNYIRVEFPSPDVEMLIIMKKTGLPKKHAEKVVKIASEMRKAHAGDRVLVSATMRRTIAAARNIAAGQAPEVAWQYALQNRCTPEDAQVVADLVNRVYGQAAKKPVA